MIRTESRGAKVLAALAVALLLGGCASAPKVDGGGSGFLPSYDSLREVSDADGVRYLSSGPFRQRAEKVTRVHVMPAQLFPQNVSFPDVDAQTVRSALQYLDRKPRADMAQHFTVVDSADQAQLVFRPAVTRIAAVEQGMKPLDFIPIRLVAKPLKDAVLGTPQQSAAVLEVLTIDPRDNTVVHASYRPGVGKPVGREGSADDRVSLESIQPVIDEWARSLAGEAARALR
jgi:hypothetical protein